MDPDPAFQVNPDPDTNPGFDGQKLKKKKIQLEFFFSPFFIKNCNFLIPMPPDVQATEAISPQKRTSST